MKKAVTGEAERTAKDSPDIIDLRDLEAPEPMVRILLDCTKLGLDETYRAHLPHVPNPLFPHLQSRGLTWRIHEQADGSAMIEIRRSS